MRGPERLIESLLWNSRYLVIIAVFGAVISSLAMFFIGTVDVVRLFEELLAYATADLDHRPALHAAVVTEVAEIIDAFLFATILLIFGLGLYELFVSKIELAERSPLASNILLIVNLDDLKDRLAQVIFLLLIVRYFEYALEREIASSLDLLYLAVGIALIAAALYLTGAKKRSGRAGD